MNIENGRGRIVTFSEAVSAETSADRWIGDAESVHDNLRRTTEFVGRLLKELSVDTLDVEALNRIFQYHTVSAE